MWTVSNNKSHGYKRVYWFVDTINTLNYISAKSGYWLLSLAVLIVSWILPAVDSEKYHYWYDSAGVEGAAWGGPMSVFTYLLFSILNSIV